MVQVTLKDDPETVARLTEFHAAHEQLRIRHDDLLRKYPDQWIAINSSGVVIAANEELEELVKMYDQEDYRQGRIAIGLMETEPRLMIL